MEHRGVYKIMEADAYDYFAKLRDNEKQRVIERWRRLRVVYWPKHETTIKLPGVYALAPVYFDPEGYEWRKDDIASQPEPAKTRLQRDRPDVWGFVQNEPEEEYRKKYPGRSPYERAGGQPPEGQAPGLTELVRDADGRRWTAEEIGGYDDEKMRSLMDERRDVYEAYGRYLSDQMGPPGRPQAKWDDESQQEYEERLGHRNSFSEQVKRHQRRIAQPYVVVQPDGTTRAWTWWEVDRLAPMERERLFMKHPGMDDWFNG